jgi:ABC-2 type transport system permease protein
MRAIVTGGDFRGTTLLWSTCLSALYIVLAVGFFSRIHRQAVRTGLLARYSAESVN